VFRELVVRFYLKVRPKTVVRSFVNWAPYLHYTTMFQTQAVTLRYILLRYDEHWHQSIHISCRYRLWSCLPAQDFQ